MCATSPGAHQLPPIDSRRGRDSCVAQPVLTQLKTAVRTRACMWAGTADDAARSHPPSFCVATFSPARTLGVHDCLDCFVCRTNVGVSHGCVTVWCGMRASHAHARHARCWDTWAGRERPAERLTPGPVRHTHVHTWLVGGRCCVHGPRDALLHARLAVVRLPRHSSVCGTSALLARGRCESAPPPEVQRVAWRGGWAITPARGPAHAPVRPGVAHGRCRTPLAAQLTRGADSSWSGKRCAHGPRALPGCPSSTRKKWLQLAYMGNAS
jgi:hypothetical protein